MQRCSAGGHFDLPTSPGRVKYFPSELASTTGIYPQNKGIRKLIFEINGKQDPLDPCLCATRISHTLYEPFHFLGPSKCDTERAKALGSNKVGHFIPKCASNGDYERRQNHGSTGQSWCVNPKTGVEIPGTRTRRPSRPFYCG